MQSRQFAKVLIKHGSGRFLLQHSLLLFLLAELPQQPMQDIGNIAAQSGASGRCVTVDQGSK